MNKDEIQQIKALIKLRCIKKVIDILQELNLVENEKDMKQYNIILDYMKSRNNDFTTFMVKIESIGLETYLGKNPKAIFDFNFKLRNEETGFAIFKQIREYFVKKNDLQYPFFSKNTSYNDNLKYTMHCIKTNHHVDLISKIHTKTDEIKLEKFNDRIYDIYKEFIRKIHTVDSDKDEIQILKADKKKEIAFIIIDMLIELSKIDDEKKPSYEILLEQSKMNDCTESKMTILKNNKVIPFSIKFKLKDSFYGIKILNEIMEYYIKNSNVFFDSYDSNISEFGTKNYRIISGENINITYKIPKQYFDDNMKQFKNSFKQKNPVKKEKIYNYKSE